MAKIQKTSKRSDSSSTLVSNLPSSLIAEILIKLPIKSIIRCRCVCKSWKNLISGKYFSTLYLKNSPFTLLMQCEYIHKSIENQQRIDYFFFFEIGSNGDKLYTRSNLSYKLPKTGKLELVNSCNGLLCLVHGPRYEDNTCFDSDPCMESHCSDYTPPSQQKDFWDHYYNNEVVYIMNPLVGDVIMLPKANWKDNTRYVLYDFGFCTQSNQYKVLRVVKYGPAEGHDMYFEIFTIGVDHKWRSFQDSSLTCTLFSDEMDYEFEDLMFTNRISNRIVHEGIVYFRAHIDRYSIYGFDLENEKGRRIRLPCEFEFIEFGGIEFSVCDGDLCLCANLSSNQYITYIWTMERFGMVESWSRKVIFGKPDYCYAYTQFLPQTYLRDGDLLMFIGDEDVIAYNEKTKVFREFTYAEDGRVFFGYVPNFVPMSSVFLPDDCETTLSSSNALNMLEMADHFLNQSLKEAALNFIVKNMEDIVFSPKFDAFALENPHLSVQITRASFKVFNATNSASPLPGSSSPENAVQILSSES